MTMNNRPAQIQICCIVYIGIAMKVLHILILSVFTDSVNLKVVIE